MLPFVRFDAKPRAELIAGRRVKIAAQVDRAARSRARWICLPMSGEAAPGSAVPAAPGPAGARRRRRWPATQVPAPEAPEPSKSRSRRPASRREGPACERPGPSRELSGEVRAPGHGSSRRRGMILRQEAGRTGRTPVGCRDSQAQAVTKLSKLGPGARLGPCQRRQRLRQEVEPSGSEFVLREAGASRLSSTKGRSPSRWPAGRDLAARRSGCAASR